MRTNRLRSLKAALWCGAVLAALPATAAAAGTATFDGTTTTITGSAGPDDLSVSRTFEGTLSITGVTPGAGCAYSRDDDPSSTIACPVGSGGVVVNALGGGDRVNWTDWGEPLLAVARVRIDLGDGNDVYSSSQVDGPATVRGGAGADDIEGSRQGDDLDGGAGNDKVRGFEGDDIVRGGDGDDEVSGDSTLNRGADVIDGGAGRDSTDDWGDSESHAWVTMDGAANDGFADEHDNVVGVEQIRTGAGLDFDGDDGENHVTAGEVATTSAVLAGRGGNDTLIGTDRADRIDGGTGDDELQGGYGNDMITGGPGQDTIMGDRPARCNEMHCDLSPGSAADTIDAVDGEVDTISCGPGTDVVRADAIDRVDADCEQVTRSGAAAQGGTPGSGAGGGSVGAGAGSSGFTVRTTKLGTALTRGIKVRLESVAAGRRVTVTASIGGRSAGRGTAKASRSGAATVTVRLTKAARRRLAGKRRATVTLRGAGRTARVTLRR